jgi:hypothetical protein
MAATSEKRSVEVSRSKGLLVGEHILFTLAVSLI